MYALQMQKIGNSGKKFIVAYAETIDSLKDFVNKRREIEYEESLEHPTIKLFSGQPFVEKITKYFKKGSCLEWFFPPEITISVFPSYIDLGTKEEHIKSAALLAEKTWNDMIANTVNTDIKNEVDDLENAEKKV